ncbi:MAG: methylamine utilization protein [Proteobacteria bacterium]|nr:methylamine utilization protein [Pseudomonadota bacterium]
MKTLPYVLLLLVPFSTATAVEPSPQVTLHGSIRSANPDAAVHPDLSETVVFFRPFDPVPLSTGADAEMRMANKTFDPAVLAITAGTRVVFPNFDPILHNAFSTSPQARFDLDFYGKGEARDHVFDSAGLVRIYCNVHHGMVGYVMVLDTPFFTQPDSRGKFTLVLPEGLRGELYVWHPQGRILKSTWVSANDARVFSIDFNGRRIPRHMNKHGRPYERKSARRY